MSVMFDAGQAEIDAVAAVIRSGKLFRYGGASGGVCDRFERRYAMFVGSPHCGMTSSGSAALVAGLTGVGVGPGDEVLVPAHTYMATALAVLAVGAIPVVVDIDEAITLDPEAVRDAIGPSVAAMIPVHMWGLPCDMDPLLAIAADHDLRVVEDACQGVGGTYHGRGLGSLGDAGAYSFNYYKHITCGEGGAVVARNPRVFARARCRIDACAPYWAQGMDHADANHFAAAGSRASEIEAAMLEVQLDRLPGWLDTLRQLKRRLTAAARDAGLTPAPVHDPDGDCASYLLLQADTPDDADTLADRLGGEVLLHTGRHTYTDWAPLLAGRGGHHPAMDPYRMPANRHLRRELRPDQCPRSLVLVGRTVRLSLHPSMDDAAVDAWIHKMQARPVVAAT
jgi:dTDP-4-amino-4,6-dideoxygalactose transaminase